MISRYIHRNNKSRTVAESCRLSTAIEFFVKDARSSDGGVGSGLLACVTPGLQRGSPLNSVWSCLRRTRPETGRDCPLKTAPIAIRRDVRAVTAELLSSAERTVALTSFRSWSDQRIR
ncbi:hypothetical protein EVAR_6115_1 [Eumeta japonica]|uniref:Uncharacterized protein n=1 Tax=Eumeta variegata TaxID=151549 RepID=A0A4C1TH66_EUMVA|nr:hypothetical protein EVAR_6115_1 [Eumeta japonica]